MNVEVVLTVIRARSNRAIERGTVPIRVRFALAGNMSDALRHVGRTRTHTQISNVMNKTFTIDYKGKKSKCKYVKRVPQEPNDLTKIRIIMLTRTLASTYFHQY